MCFSSVFLLQLCKQKLFLPREHGTLRRWLAKAENRRGKSHCYQRNLLVGKRPLGAGQQICDQLPILDLLKHSTSPALPVSARSYSEDFSSHSVMRKLAGKTIMAAKNIFILFILQEEGRLTIP
jgi:hypothetical protein